MKIASKILIGLVIIMAIGLLISAPKSKADDSVATQKNGEVMVSEPFTPALSLPVSEIPSRKPEQILNREINPIRNPGLFMADLGLPGSNTTDKDPLVELSKLETGRTPTPLLTFEGLGTDGYTPPDTMGEVGPNHYVQMVNVSFAVYDKNGNVLKGDTLFTDLFVGSGLSQCSTQNDGDPVVLWDSMADRWLLSQFAVTTSPYHMCVAISQTPDPTGAYYLYQFSMPDFPDYFKFGVWPDAYYMGTNTGYPNQYYAYAFDRDAMLAGQPATYQYSNGHPNFLLPADLDGPTQPPVDSPGYFYTQLAQGYPNHPTGVDRIVLYEFDVDWDTPANSTFGIAQEIPIADYNYTTCGFFAGDCIPQPGTTQKLDAVDPWPMWRFAYRNLGPYEALVGNFTVDTNGADHAGIRWFELQKQGAAPWNLYQEGTHSPDSDHRWMGSIAMDGSGNIALGYSVSSLTTYPSLRYATRLRGDTLGTLQAEATMYAGGGSQTGPYDRWGDYSSMSIDPADECTFWYTGEYHDVSATSSNWNTRIGKFRLPECTGALEDYGTLSGTVTDASTSGPLAGATVQATLGGNTLNATTNTSGVYEFSFLGVGTYDVTASAFGYAPSTVTAVSVTSGGTTSQDFALSPAASATVSGVVTDATTGWPLYASIDIAGYPGSPIWTNPETGAYSVQLPQGSSYDFTVSAWVDGYTDVTQSVGPITGNTTQNFTLNADLVGCEAPGYGSATYLTESFDTITSFPDGGWNKVDTSTGTSGDWATSTATVHPSGQAPHSGARLAYFNSWTATSGHSTRLFRTIDLNLSSASAPILTFWMYHDTGYSTSNDRIQVQVSTNGGSSWANVGTAVSRYNGSTGWQQHTIALTAYAGVSTVRIGFNAISAYGNDIHIDDVSVTEQNCAAPSGGLVIGNVYNANMTAGVNGATVSNQDGYATTSVATPLDPNVDDGFYTLYSPAGSKTFTAAATGYSSDVDSVNVVANSTVRHDFSLDSGLLSYTPAAVAITIPAGSTTNQPLTLANDGGIAANFSLLELGTVVNTTLDDGGMEDNIGLTGGGQFVWFNRFTPAAADFPFKLRQVSVVFPATVAVGDVMQLLVWEDADSNPGNGATLLHSVNVQVINNDSVTWNNYQLSTPVSLNGPGDVLIGFVNRSGGSGYADYPAAIDQTATQGRSWVGSYGGNVPEPPTFPATNLWGTIDSYGLPGNWLIRGLGYQEVPWLNETPSSGLVAALNSQLIDLAFNATTLTPGQYTTQLATHHDTPSTVPNVPITMTVVTDYAWNGSQGSAWNNALNWTPNGVPNGYVRVLVDPVYLTGVDWPALDIDPAVFDLTVAAGAELTIPNGRSLTVNGALTNNGLLRQTIDIAGPTFTRFLHITGSGGAKYYGVDITPAGAMGPTTVEIRGNQAAGCNQGDQLAHRCFDIAPTTPQTAVVRFWYLSDERNNQDTAVMRAYHWNGGSWDRLDPGGEQRGSGGSYHYVEVDGVSAYSPFGLTDSDPDEPTAVSLQTIRAVGTNTAVLPLILLSLFLLLAAGWVLRRR